MCGTGLKVKMWLCGSGLSNKLGLKAEDKLYNIELINGRLKEIGDCVVHLERIRNNYVCEMMQQWRAADGPY